MLFQNILLTNGNTPLVRICNMGPQNKEILLKLEAFNMGGSTKDRIAVEMIKQAEIDGILKPGMTIVESSSGNTAIGLAIVAAQKGYKFVAVCDRHLPTGKLNRLKALGADIAFIPPTPEGMDTVELRIEVAKRIVLRLPDSITLNQYSNRSNVDAHYNGTGPEILKDTGGVLDACVIFCGTCGSISGIGGYLKQHNPNIKIIAVEPVGSAIFGGELKPYLIAGGGLSFTPSILDRSVVDEIIRVSDFDAFSAARELARCEGIMVGSSGGGVVKAAFETAERLVPGSRVVGVIPDIGDRYIDSLYDDSWLKQHGLANIVENKNENPALFEAVQAEKCFLNVF